MTDILLVGAGNLGGALLQGWLHPDPVTDSVVVLTKSGQPRDGALKDHPRITFTDTCPVLDPETLVVLAVKPGAIREAYESIRPKLNKGQRIVSVAAGVSIEKLKEMDPQRRWSRAMPSIAAAKRRSLTALCTDDARIESLFDAVGHTVRVKDDRGIDFATLTGASGPGVVAWQAQQWLEACQEFGLDEESAKLFILGMMNGSVALIRGNTDFKDLVSRIATKGGTTEAMIKACNDGGMPDAIKASIQAALDRAAAINDAF